MTENTYVIEIPNWCKIGRLVEIKDIRCIRGDDKNHWYKECIISFGYDGFFHKAYNCPVYYTEFEEFGKTVRLVEE